MARTYRLKKAGMACLLFACAATVIPAHAAPFADQAGRVRFVWLGPSGEGLNDALGLAMTGTNGTFGYAFAVPSTWVGRVFSLNTDPAATPVLTSPTDLYLADVDVYFYSQQGYPGDNENPPRNWDAKTGVSNGPETGRIPAGTTKAFVVISTLTPAAHDVNFKFTVS